MLEGSFSAPQPQPISSESILRKKRDLVFVASGLGFGLWAIMGAVVAVAGCCCHCAMVVCSPDEHMPGAFFQAVAKAPSDIWVVLYIRVPFWVPNTVWHPY